MIKAASRALLRGAVLQLGRLAVTRRLVHAASLHARGAAVAFLRARRLVPNDVHGLSHPDRLQGAAMTPTELERELVLTQKTLRFVHMREAIEHLARGERLSEGMAVLTFDESFAATTQLALPVLRRLGIPFCVFVTTGHLHSASTLWDESVRAALAALAPNPLRVPWIDRVLETDTAKHRAASVRRLLLSLASLDESRLHRRLDELFARTGGLPVVASLDRMLRADDLVALSRDALVSFGAHGHEHLSFAAASDAALHAELEQPRALLLQLCGASFCDVVSYPFGRPPYIDDRVYAAARAAGYRAGLTAEPGVARPADHLFRLPRLPIGPASSGIAAYELHGGLEALDALLLATSNERERLDASLQG